MIRQFAIFGLALILGLLVQATLVHSLFPTSIAPDFILILVVYLGLFSRTPGGTLGAFLMGLAGDFATARFVGPTAAGCVVAFCLTVEVSNRIYAEKGPTVILVSFIASLAKSATYLLMVYVYTSSDIFTLKILWTVAGEAFFTAVLSPILIYLISVGRSRAASRSQPIVESFRRS